MSIKQQQSGVTLKPQHVVDNWDTFKKKKQGSKNKNKILEGYKMKKKKKQDIYMLWTE